MIRTSLFVTTALLTLSAGLPVKPAKAGAEPNLQNLPHSLSNPVSVDSAAPEDETVGQAIETGTKAAPAGDQAARMEQGAKNFVDSVAKRGIGFLNNDALSDVQKRTSFRALLRDSFDLSTIGRFALGRYWRVASQSQRAEYQRLFEQMVVDVYSERFSQYDGQQLQTAEAKAVSSSDTIVTSYVVPKDGGEKVRVDWRIRSSGNGFKVVDVIVEGVSMSVTQRSDFAAVIQRGGGDVGILIDHLKNPSRG